MEFASSQLEDWGEMTQSDGLLIYSRRMRSPAGPGLEQQPQELMSRVEGFSWKSVMHLMLTAVRMLLPCVFMWKCFIQLKISVNVSALWYHSLPKLELSSLFLLIIAHIVQSQTEKSYPGFGKHVSPMTSYLK